MDTLTRRQRSERMSRIRGKNTGPEREVQKLLAGLGYRYRRHQVDLPSKPDFVFRNTKKVVFVNGCFWHGHRCFLGRIPKSRVDFWVAKINSNRKRGLRARAKLRRMGWGVLVVWECQLKNQALKEKLRAFLSNA
jgi:DNA mismatch endonuclease, patch repair protein